MYQSILVIGSEGPPGVRRRPHQRATLANNAAITTASSVVRRALQCVPNCCRSYATLPLATMCGIETRNCAHSSPSRRSNFHPCRYPQSCLFINNYTVFQKSDANVAIFKYSWHKFGETILRRKCQLI